MVNTKNKVKMSLWDWWALFKQNANWIMLTLYSSNCSYYSEQRSSKKRTESSTLKTKGLEKWQNKILPAYQC